MTENYKTDTIHQWIHSNRLYEVHIFYYALIIAFWVMVGFFSLGFEIDSLSSEKNLFINFIWYLTICLLMTISLVIFCNTYEANKYEKYLETLEKEIEENLTDEEKEIVWELIEEQGHTLPTNKQRFAMLFLGGYFLFELFFISSWVKDLALVWEPKWVSVLIEWVRANTDFVSDEGVNHQLFSVYISNEDTRLKSLFTSERDFLSSDFGAAASLYQFLKISSFFFLITAISTILWKILDWIGFEKINPSYINSFKSVFWSVLITFGLIFMSLGLLMIFCNSINHSSYNLFGKNYWLQGVFWYFPLIFFVIMLKYVLMWLILCKNLFIYFFKL